MASSLRDVTEFLHRARLKGLDAADTVESELIEWRRGSPMTEILDHAAGDELVPQFGPCC